MITANVDGRFYKIAITCTKQSSDVLLKGLIHSLKLLRPLKEKDVISCLESIEMWCYRLRCIQNHAELKNTFDFSMIEAYGHLQTLRYALAHYRVQETFSPEQGEEINSFIHYIRDTIEQAIGTDSDFHQISEVPFAVSLVYIQYLKQIYRPDISSREENILHFIHLCRRIPMDSPELIEEDRHILPYGIFNDRCIDWMHRNNMEDICLEEVLEDERFMTI